MARSIYIAAVLVGFLGLIGSSSGENSTNLRCFFGTGSAKVEKECSPTDVSCKKHKVDHVPGVYSCSSDDKDGCEKEDALIDYETCYCKTDLCNGAEDVARISGVVMAIVLAVSLLLRKML